MIRQPSACPRQLRAWALVLVPLAALAAESLGRGARADSARVVVIGDTASPAGREAIGQSAARALGEAGWEAVVERAPARTLTDGLTACYRGADPQACRATVSAEGAATQVLAIEISGAEATAGGPQVTLTAWLLTAEGSLVHGDRRFCAPCGEGDLEAVAHELVSVLMREAAGSVSRSVLRVRSRPAGARVLVDGVPVGLTDLDYAVYPGRRRISIDKPGYRIELREVEAPAGATLELEVELERRAEPAAPGAGGRRTLAWVLGGAGVAAAAGGVTLMLIDTPRLDEHGKQNRSFRRSFWPGVGLTGAGVGMVGAGIWLLLRRPAPEPSRVPAVGMHIGEGELWVVGSGQF
jgi:hypothetical protein